MLDRVFKALPYLFGFLIGWIMLYPPDWMAPLGAWRFLASFLLAMLLWIVTLTVLWRVLRKTTPYIGPVQNQPETERRIREVLMVGFTLTGCSTN